MKTQIAKELSSKQLQHTSKFHSHPPRVDIIEDIDKLTIVAEMPGVSADGVDVKIEGRELTITGVCHKQLTEGFTSLMTEYRRSNYRRSFTLGDAIDEASIGANMKDGVLTLTLPKATKIKARKIVVKQA